MNKLIINGKDIGNCSIPRMGKNKESYVFLMEDGYYVTIENKSIKNKIALDDKSIDEVRYYFDLY